MLAVQRSSPSIVNIRGEKTLGSENALAPGEANRRVNGMGTGVIIDERGYILTNHHVVEGVRQITVTTLDKESYQAELISHDPKTDLAIIKIESDESLPVIEIGTSSDLMPGETVIAVGNAYGYDNTVTRGIISALHRPVQVSDTQHYEDLIQTDASINPGNSGGPLLNVEGKMIGLNVAVRAGAQGIGFAIPADHVMEIATDLMSTRRVKNTWHGVVLETKAEPEQSGVTVQGVEEGSPGADCGLRPGDIIRSVGKQAIQRALDIERALLGHRAGETVEVTIDRDQEPVRIKLTMATLPKRATNANDDTWEVLGLRLESISKRDFAKYRSRYRGGLTVTEVRSGSPAARQGIRGGDVLVGMHVWETVSMENVAYILGRPDFEELDPVKFYILRGKETLYGHMTVSHRQ